MKGRLSVLRRHRTFSLKNSKCGLRVSGQQLVQTRCENASFEVNNVSRLAGTLHPLGNLGGVVATFEGQCVTTEPSERSSLGGKGLLVMIS